MDGYMYVPAETGDAYSPTVQVDGPEQIDGDLFDAPDAVSNLHLAIGAVNWQRVAQF